MPVCTVNSILKGGSNGLEWRVKIRPLIEFVQQIDR